MGNLLKMIDYTIPQMRSDYKTNFAKSLRKKTVILYRKSG